MKKFSLVLAMLALVLVLGLAFVSCGDGDGNVSGGGGNPGYRIASIMIYILTGNIQQSINYNYDSNGFCSRIEYIYNGTVSSVATCFYNDSGWLIRRVSSDSRGNMIYQEDFEYEFGENLVRRIMHNSGSTIKTEIFWSGSRVDHTDFYNENNTLTNRISINYGSSGKIAYSQFVDYVNGTTTITTPTYGSNGRMLYGTETQDGVTINRQDYTYEDGNGYFGSDLDPYGNVLPNIYGWY